MSGNKISDHMKARNNICKALDWKWEKREKEMSEEKLSKLPPKIKERKSGGRDAKEMERECRHQCRSLGDVIRLRC